MSPPERYAEMSLEDLRAEALMFKLTNIPEDRAGCIKLLTSHLEKNGPLSKLPRPSRSAEEEEQLPAQSTPGSPHSGISEQNFYTVRGPAGMENSIGHLCNLLSEQLKLQSEAMRQQQQLLQQVLASMPANQSPMAYRDRPLEAHTSASHQNQSCSNNFMGIEAAAAKLTKVARRWFDLSSEEINKSWRCFKAAILDRFKRKILYDAVRRRAEARKWNPTTESFQDYSMNKLALMRNLKLEDIDAIQFTNREMQHITANCSNVLKKFAPTNYKLEKFKDNNPKFAKGNDTNNSTAKGVQQQKPGRFDSHCVYCRGKDHVRNECPKLKKKEASKPPHTTGQPTAVAVVEAATDGAASSVACVQGNSKKMSFADPVVKVVKIGSTVCSKTALVDTGSPISFINAS
ncbi:hypothetical protein RF55_12270, partial [Lasius niger]